MSLFCPECHQPLELEPDAEARCPFCGTELGGIGDRSPSVPRDQASDVVAAPHPLAIGRYRIVRKLGVGGLAEVYEGQDDELGRAVAVKILHPELLYSPRAVERFLEEARILAGLDHPGIVPVHDAGRTPDGRCYLVIKLFRGSDLAERLKAGRVPRDEAVEIVAQAATALDYAHRHGLVHRDVKPANLLLDGPQHVVVADFGLALRGEHYGTGPAFVGTVPYMSPEQARHEGHRVDARTDVYGLGVVLYELLTGRRPFSADNEAELLERIKSDEPIAPRRLDDTIPAELDRVCRKALAKRPSDRYETAQELADDLRYWQKLVALASASSTATVRAAITPSPVVPRGLRAFAEEDAGFYLSLLPGARNRDGLPESVAFWKARLESLDPRQAVPLGVLYGPSGCGKSSLMKAGVLPRLADHVHVLFVESCSDEAGARLRSALYRRFPWLPPDVSLASVLEAVRRKHAAEEGRKVVIVIDQFEQWLHAARPAAVEQFTLALRQCDGTTLQCVLLVRDEFWLPMSRLLRGVEVRLEEGVNSTLVDLFDPLHARRVLADFGRAFGRLPETGAGSADSEKFLERIIAGLAEGGRVAPVRLSLFAEMVKGKPWTLQTLQDMGGVGRIGEAFLEESFGAAASPARRAHAQAAGAVLHALLPKAGMQIKGHMRSRAELLEASGYGAQPDAFDDLFNLLVHDLHLVSPASPGAEALPTYQLTHDYLVPSIRAWLTRRQRETRRGRASLQLAQCSEWWNVRPEDRHLPAPGEWAKILLFTSRRDWTELERTMMRRANRYYASRAVVALVGMLVLGGSAAVLQRERRLQLERQQTDALVEHLKKIRSSQWSNITAEVRRLAPWAIPQLRLALEDPSTTSSERLHVRMALLSVDPDQVAPLCDALMQAGPAEHEEILLALRPFRSQVVPLFWETLQDPTAMPARRFRAAAALAAFDPEDPRWSSAASVVASELVGQDLLFLREWLPSLRAVRTVLVPRLMEPYHDASNPARQARATEALADYAADQPNVLSNLLLDAGPDQFRQLIPAVRPHANAVANRMNQALDESPLSVTSPDAQARRRVRAGIALVRLNRPERAWPLFRLRSDPRVRSFLVHAVAPCEVDPNLLIDQWKTEPDVTARRTLLLSLGEFSEQQLPAEHRAAMIPALLTTYRTEADQGTRAAVEWLLRRWRKQDLLMEVDRKRITINARTGSDRTGWFVNTEDHTMVVLTPEAFLMGAPATEPGRLEGETQHRRVIPRTYAIAAKPVSRAQLARFEKHHPVETSPDALLYTPEADSVATPITWYLAAKYCRWLSEQEGVPEAEMCFPPVDQIKPGMTLPENYLSRTGYRLPTEAEWEYACRANTTTMRFYGDADDLLDHYAWYVHNAQDHAWPAGLLKPNDFGLFDMSGNVAQWCMDRYRPYPTADAKAVIDEEEPDRTIPADQARVMRGGSFTRRAAMIRSAMRYPHLPTYSYINVGMRVARTCR